MALKQCLGCESCVPHSPEEQCSFPASSLCLVPPGFAMRFLFVLLKIPTALAWCFWTPAPLLPAATSPHCVLSSVQPPIVSTSLSVVTLKKISLSDHQCVKPSWDQRTSWGMLPSNTALIHIKILTKLLKVAGCTMEKSFMHTLNSSLPPSPVYTKIHANAKNIP